MVSSAQNEDQETGGGPEHFARQATSMGTPPVVEATWNDLHVQTMRLKPGGWSHPGSSYVRLTVPLSRDGRVRRRLPGESKSWVPGTKRRGTLSVTPPGTEGDWEWLDHSHFGLMFLPETLLREALDNAGASSIELSLRPAFAESNAIVGPVFAAMCNESEVNTRGSRLLVSSAALFLARHLLAEYGATDFSRKSPTGALDNACLQRVVEAVEARLGYDWSVDEMAREAGLSPFWFAHLFKEKVGVSPRTFVQRRRLACARRMLADGHMSLTDIAAHCGFGSQSWFTTAFRREHGITPAAYRRCCR